MAQNQTTSAQIEFGDWLYDPNPYSALSIIVLLLCLITSWQLSRPRSRYTLNRQVASCTAAYAATMVAITLLFLPWNLRHAPDFLYSIPMWNSAQSVAVGFGILFALSAFRGPSLLVSTIAYAVLVPSLYLGLLFLSTGIDLYSAGGYSVGLDSSELLSRSVICVASTLMLAMFSRSLFKNPRTPIGNTTHISLVAVVSCALFYICISIDEWIEAHATHIIFYEVPIRQMICLLCSTTLAIFSIPYIGWCRGRAKYALRCLEGACPYCTYELRGSIGQSDCPECGKPIPWERVVLPAD